MVGLQGETLAELTPERRALAEETLAEYQNRRPVGRVYVEVVGERHGEAEVRFSSVDEIPGWEVRLFDRAIVELQSARAVFEAEQ